MLACRPVTMHIGHQKLAGLIITSLSLYCHHLILAVHFVLYLFIYKFTDLISGWGNKRLFAFKFSEIDCGENKLATVGLMVLNV